MKQKSGDICISTSGRDLIDVTRQISRWVAQSGISEGVLTVFIQHSSASLTIQENADPDVQLDLQDFYAELVPEGHQLYRHSAEGADDMPAHIKSALTDVSLTIPVTNGRSTLGAWQGVYLFEHRHAPHQRRVILHYLGN